MLRAQHGDSAAWQELVRSCNALLFAHAVTLLGNSDTAQDAVQDAWMAALRGIRRLQDPAHFRAWIMRIVSNKCADHIRRMQRRRAATKALTEDAIPAFDPAVAAQAVDEIDALRQGLRQLPPDRRALLTMLYLRSMRIAEIAVVLDVPPGTVKSRLYHAREQLRALMNRTSPQNDSLAAPTQEEDHERP